jgi:hypothetical protein
MALQGLQKTTNKQGHLNVLIYGEPGTGKTRFIGTAQPKFKTLIASAESGLLSLGDGYDNIKVTNFEQLEEIWKHLQFEKHDYKCFAMDSGTEIQKICMEYILHKNKRDKAQMQDWGELGDKMARLIRTMRDMDIHFVMTALLDETKDEATGEVKAYPAFKGSLARQVAGYFDEVLFSYSTSKKNERGEIEAKYQLLTRNSGKYVAKDRSGKLPSVIEPDFTAMYNTIYKQEENVK